MRRLGSLRSSAAVAVAAAGLVAGCGGSSGFRIDHSVVENAIGVALARQQHTLAVVSCPVGLQARKGDHFTCTVTFANGTQSPVSVSEIDDHGNVHYAGLRGFVNGHKRP